MRTHFHRLRGRRHRGKAHFGAVAGLSALLLTGSAVTGEGRESTVRSSDRVLHRFTFTEPDNFDQVPKYWVPFRTLPSFTIGRFDGDVGHETAPSFYLGLNGRDVAFRYGGPPTETPVRPDSDYQIVGWIKPDRLRTARARLTAFYVDREGNPITATQVWSPLVGGESPDSWQSVAVHLPAGPREAQTVGLTVRVMQQRTWRTGSRPHRYIEPTDVQGGAWFDDIVIYRLPRARISTRASGNVFVRPDRPTIETVVTDSEPGGLTASLQLRDATGRIIGVREVPIGTGSNVAACRFRFPGLEPGLYRATLRVEVEQKTLVTRHRTFAYLAESYRSGGAISRSFGVVLDGPGQTEDQLGLLLALGAGTLKLPLWGVSRTQAGFADARAALDHLLHDLVKARVAMIGVFAGAPNELVRNAGEVPRPLLEILTDDPAGWRTPLARVVAPYASIFRSWQIGGDDDPSVTNSGLLPGTLRAVRRQMRTLVTSPRLAAPADAHTAPGEQLLPAEEISLTIGSDIQPAWIAEHLKSYQRSGYHQVGAYIQPNRRGYDRIADLADLAKRVIHARHAGAARVVLPPLWNVRPTVNGLTTEPTEEFILYRTILDILADANPGPVLSPAPGVKCLSFTAGGEAVLALWDEAAPPQGRTHVLQLGSATRQIDLWGRATSLDRTNDGRQIVRLSSLPVFVDHVEQWLVAFRARFRFAPSEIEFRIGSHTHTLTVAAPDREPLNGTIELDAAPSWEVRPRKFSFALSAGGVLEKKIEIRYANNEPAGQKEVIARVHLDSGRAHRIDVPLRFELGLPGIDVWAYAAARGDRIVVRHGVRNRSGEVVSFRGFAAVPGRTRQYRVYTALQPGQSIVKEYHFEDAANLSGRTLRVGLREVGGPRAHNLEIAAP